MHEYGAAEAVCYREVSAYAKCAMGLVSEDYRGWRYARPSVHEIVYYGDPNGKIETDDEAHKNEDAYKVRFRS